MTEETARTEKEATATLPQAPTKEKPIFDLQDILKSRRGKGEGLGVAEAILFLDYMDRKDDRLYRREQAEKKPRTPSPNPEVQTLKTEVSSLKESVGDLVETLRTQRVGDAQKEFVEEINKGIKNEILPTVQALEKRVDELAERAKTAPAEGMGAKPSELTEATRALRDAIDKLGEKAGAKALSLDDVDKILGIMEKLRGNIPKEAAGEFDWRTTGITTAGEVATEFIKAYKEVAGSKEETYAEKEVPSAQRNIIERQLLLYLQRKMKEGAATFSPYEAAEELGTTPRQIMLALEALTKKGLWKPPTQPQGAKKRVRKQKTPQEKGEIAGVVQEGEIFRPA